MNKTLLTFLLLIVINENLKAQDPHRFEEEIKIINELPATKGKDLTVFTGSSSIRLWKNLTRDCHGMQVINTGFGGSHMSDLLYFIEQTVLRFKPTKVYIYEGDNDIAELKEPKAILKTAKEVTNKILESNQNTKIYFISAKPSPSRWAFKEKYVAFNSLLKEYCDSNNQLFYTDVWGAMLDKNGLVAPHIFISDSLHMNRQGYLLWKDIICRDSE
jgi:lysophospholipase L1-like esterase